MIQNYNIDELSQLAEYNFGISSSNVIPYCGGQIIKQTTPSMQLIPDVGESAVLLLDFSVIRTSTSGGPLISATDFYSNSEVLVIINNLGLSVPYNFSAAIRALDYDKNSFSSGQFSVFYSGWLLKGR